MSKQEDLSEFLQFPLPGTSQDCQETGDSFKWTHNSTLIFLDLYAKYRKCVGTLKMKSLKKMYEEISKEMRLITKINISAANCENRWKHLERQYKKYIDNNKQTGRGRKDFEYAIIMDEILGKKKNVHPVELLAAETIVELDLPKENVQKMDLVTENTEMVIQKVRPKPKKFKVDILTEIRRDRREFYNTYLDIEQKKLEAKIQKNSILQEKNLLLKQIIEKNISVPTTDL